jgi:hypothetical protein
VKLFKRVKPGTWVTAAVLAFFLAVGGSLAANYIAAHPAAAEVTLGLYNNKSADRKLNERVEVAVRLALKDTSAKSYPVQLEGRGDGAWQVIKKYTATKPDNTIVFRIHPGRLGDIVYRAEVKTPSGVIVSNELVLHITK